MAVLHRGTLLECDLLRPVSTRVAIISPSYVGLHSYETKRRHRCTATRRFDVSDVVGDVLLMLLMMWLMMWLTVMMFTCMHVHVLRRNLFYEN